MPPDEDDKSDAGLVLRAVEGEAEAFSALFQRHYGAVRGFAYRVMLDGHAADDVAQETFICAARKLGSLRDGQAFVAWVFRIASNVARSHLRAQRSHHRKLSAAEAAGPVTNDEGEPADEPSIRAFDAMCSLPPKQREAVVLVILDGLSHREASLRLGCAESTVSWRIFCAKRTPRRKMES